MDKQLLKEQFDELDDILLIEADTSAKLEKVFEKIEEIKKNLGIE